jgi:alcohol dehydrogenase class IV
MAIDVFLRQTDWDFPVPIRYGPGRLRQIGTLCAANGCRNPLIVTDRATGRLPFVDALRGFLAAGGLGHGSFADVSPNPADVEVMAGKRAFRTGGHDSVIALGGGSGMDAGKAISLVLNTDRDLWDFDFNVPPPPELGKADFVPLLCVPTTSGTGAETESTAMITDTRRGIKGCVWHPAQKPFAALLDPDLTLGLPRNLTAWTGCDALVHAIEAYCVPSWHPMCDGIALQALGLVYDALPRALDDPASVPARGAMLVGSCLGGVAFLKGLGLVHAISHMVGAECDTHHGLTNAVLLPLVLRFNAPAIADKVAPMCQAMGLAGTDFDSFRRAVCDLLDRCAIPRSLSELGVTPDRIDSIAAKAMTDTAIATNPRAVRLENVQSLIRTAMEHAR